MSSNPIGPHRIPKQQSEITRASSTDSAGKSMGSIYSRSIGKLKRNVSSSKLESKKVTVGSDVKYKDTKSSKELDLIFDENYREAKKFGEILSRDLLNIKKIPDEDYKQFLAAEYGKHCKKGFDMANHIILTSQQKDQLCELYNLLTEFPMSVNKQYDTFITYFKIIKEKIENSPDPDTTDKLLYVDFIPALKQIQSALATDIRFTNNAKQKKDYEEVATFILQYNIKLE